MDMTWRDYLGLVRQYSLRRWRLLVPILAAAAGVVSLQMASPYLIGRFLDSLGHTGGAGDFRQVWLFLVAAYVTHFAVNLVYLATTNMLMARVAGALRIDGFRRLHRATQLPCSVGDVITRLMDDVVEAHELLTRLPLLGIVNLLWLVVTIVVLARINPLFLWVILGVLPAYLVVGQVASRQIRQTNGRLLNQRSAITSEIEESLAMSDTVRAYGLQAFWAGRFSEKVSRFVALRERFGLQQGMAQSGAHLFSELLPAALLLIGGYAVVTGEMTAGVLVTSYGYASRVFAPVEALMQVVMQVSASLPALQRVQQILACEIEYDEGPPLVVRRGEIEFRDVSFAYSDKRPVLERFSARLEPGVLNFIVGPNGSGKSTLLRLLLGFVRPSSGSILVDGQDLALVSPASTRASMGVVLQDGQFLNGTILENVHLGNLAAEPSELQHHARQLGLEGLLSRVEAGWQTQVGRGGGRLSGGQAQCVALARALVRNAPILLIDEGTSNMDRDTEMAAYQRLVEILPDRTIVVVTHRVPDLTCPHRVIHVGSNGSDQTHGREG